MRYAKLEGVGFRFCKAPVEIRENGIICREMCIRDRALLRSACRGKAPFADIRGVSEGLELRLEAAVRTSTTYDELLDALTTVRYPRARMRRLAMDAALGFTADLSLIHI